MLQQICTLEQCLFKKQQSSSVLEYAPIARALTILSLDERSKQRTKRKFDMIAKEKFALTKMQPLCDLEEKHGVDLGPGYRNDHACATFIEYIAHYFKCVHVHGLHKPGS